jgi:transcriptional regulator with XRE-family HTH domain
MPLDTSDVTPEIEAVGQPADDLAPLRPIRVVLDESLALGPALRAARESLGLAIEDIAQATRIRSGYIASLEAFDLDALPPRPFAIGYLRAYARALGVEPDAIVARFVAEAPVVDATLRPPAGLRKAPRRLGVVGGVAILIAVSLTAWNIARHAKAESPRRSVVASHGSPAGVEGPAKLGAPLPPPPEASTPPAYATPGLGAALDDLPAPVLGARFVQAGPIYGGPPVSAETDVILQARKATSLIVRGQGGAVYFARELSPGEAWRAPAATAGLTVDVGNPSAVEVFFGGVSKGALATPQTPVAKLAA